MGLCDDGDSDCPTTPTPRPSPRDRYLSFKSSRTSPIFSYAENLRLAAFLTCLTASRFAPGPWGSSWIESYRRRAREGGQVLSGLPKTDTTIPEFWGRAAAGEANDEHSIAYVNYQC